MPRKEHYKPTGNPVGRPTLYKPEYCQMLVDHMRTGMSFESFAASIGTSWDVLYDWCKKYPEFLQAKIQGKALELAVWEKIAVASATGTPMNISNYKGKLNNPNSAVIIFSLKNKFPKLYRDQLKIESEIKVTDTTFQAFTENEKTKILQAALEAKLKKIQTENNESDGE